MKNSSHFFLCVCLLISTNSFADKLEKGFEKLNVFDYFSAKQYFEKELEDETAAAAYGLSLIYSTDKNPFYSSDSAHRYILIADSVFPLIKEKTKKYYAEFGVTDSAIKSLGEFICEDGFVKAKKENSVDAFNHYISYFNSCLQLNEAVSLRNIAAFDEASRLNTSAAFRNFLASYPQAEQYKKASAKYDELIYLENTDSTLESYEFFLQNFPENPYRKQAEKMIYTLNVPDRTIEQYVAFARKYKNSRHLYEAWHEVYKLAMKDYTEESFNNFKSAYPDYPYPEELETDFRLQNYFFLPYAEDGKWGYMNETGQEMIKPSFDEASFFSDGYAVVLKNGKYGYVNKAGKQVIDFQFSDAEDFHHSSAVVMKDSLYGLINKNGEFIIPPAYKELSEVSEDIYMAVKDEYSGYIMKNGDSLTSFIYDVANDFKNGFAIVSKDEKFGLISSDGELTIDLKFDDLVFVDSNLLKAMNENEQWGILSVHGDTLLPFSYDAIGDFSENRAMIVLYEKCGFVDEHGAVAIPLTYKYSTILLTTTKFKDGYALLKQKIKSIIIDTTGKVLKFPAVEDYGAPSEGLIAVRKNSKWGFADMTGKMHVPCKFQGAEPFNHGFAIIRQNNLTGLIDTSGIILISPLYEDIIVSEKALLVRSNGKNGLLSRTGILLIPCSYDKIDFLTPSLARATNPGGLTYVNLDTGRIIYSSHTE